MIDVQRLSFSFGSQWVLQDVSFRVRKGEFLFLSGPSGAGKTTLIRLLHGTHRMQGGKALVAGFDLKTTPSSQLFRLRREVGVVFQDFRILSGRTVADNVALPLRVRGMKDEIIARRVRAVLRSLQLDTRADRRCEELSGGEQQRVAIARSIIVNPKLLLADEPTGNLDKPLAMRLMEVFRQFHRHGTTVVLATHNRELMAGRPEARVLTLKDGRLLSEDEDPVGRVS
ncbi:MAG TPA: cell division ATP-binding protein FtsE [Desulfomicrobiaceae bacterium]|jgi:cell division transport system ATP-binding protein|nr:cell division ATP-binding protein FtsE [Desulfomicrobiaceae bacterium]